MFCPAYCLGLVCSKANDFSVGKQSMFINVVSLFNCCDRHQLPLDMIKKKKPDHTSDFIAGYSHDSFEKQFAACLPERTDKNKDIRLYMLSRIESINQKHAR